MNISKLKSLKSVIQLSCFATFLLLGQAAQSQTFALSCTTLIDSPDGVYSAGEYVFYLDAATGLKDFLGVEIESWEIRDPLLVAHTTRGVQISIDYSSGLVRDEGRIIDYITCAVSGMSPAEAEIEQLSMQSLAIRIDELESRIEAIEGNQ